MMKLLKIEFAKVRNYKTFWIILGVYALLVPLWFVGLCQFISNLILQGMGPKFSSVASFPEIWQHITWTTAWWNILLGILVVILTCNEISFKTERQNIIDGLSRQQLILSKFLSLLTLTLAVTIYTTLVGFAFGLYYGGYSYMFTDIEYIAYYFLQTLGYFSVAYFFAVIVRKSALVIILYLVIFVTNLFWENIIGSDAAQFLPTYLISGLTPFPFFKGFIEMARQNAPGFIEPWKMGMTLQLILGTIYIAAFFVIGFFTVKRRDL